VAATMHRVKPPTNERVIRILLGPRSSELRGTMLAARRNQDDSAV